MELYCMKNRKFPAFLFFQFLVCQALFSQTTYTSIMEGDWNTASTWDVNGIPPSPLPSTDSVIIKHDVTLVADQDILGVMFIEATGAITESGNEKLNIGKGSVDQGELINYGFIIINNLKIKPDNTCTASTGLPKAHNYNIIIVDDLEIGEDCAAGALINYLGGKITVADELHVDNYLENQDSIFVGVKIKNHGGTIDGCGYMESPLLEIDDNSGRPGTFKCIDICQNDASDPTIEVAGTTYSDLIDAFSNAPPTEASFDDDSTFVCGFNQLGIINVLPITLVYFKAITKNEIVYLNWETASELNNDYFTVERSTNGKNWEKIQTIDGAGSSSQSKQYKAFDKYPYSGVSFYRLKQTDFDGKFFYSKVVSVVIKKNNGKTAIIYPNPATHQITLEGQKSELSEVRIYSITGIDQTHLTEVIKNDYTIILLDITKLKPGLYYIRTRSLTHKFLKE